jgi:hypothetical protein
MILNKRKTERHGKKGCDPLQRGEEREARAAYGKWNYLEHLNCEQDEELRTFSYLFLFFLSFLWGSDVILFGISIK